ncbi:hypothetical protein DENSPDRAFT_833390 [Dentipellis sp. KUC8613]|nr:hypothetical protein DENSPDRAFT_833390 [Dentipellis sp. KUC8613]
MGFCRRCGDIVVGPKCKCGGTAVAPVLQWNQRESKDSVSDRWSRTYVSREKSPTRSSATPSTETPPPASVPARRFPASAAPLGHGVSAHIRSVTSSRPTSPLKHSSSFLNDPPPAADILPSPYTSELSKVYGSILQPKESLATYHCHVCSTPFPPDATIYPDPADNSGERFMCRACFTVNGGSKGDCPACHRPVLILKSEGGFVENAGKVWHKKCFSCSGCGKAIGDTPMVDLLGQPSCIDCFDTCLQRRDKPNKTSPTRAEQRPNIRTSMDFNAERRQSREGSPTIEELEHKFGILKSRDSTPAKEKTPMATSSSPMRQHTDAESSPRVPGLGQTSVLNSSSNYTEISPAKSVTDQGSPVARRSYAGGSPDPSRYRDRQPNTSPKPTQDAIDQMKKRFLQQTSSPSSADTSSDLSSPTPSKARVSTPTSRIPIRTPRASDASTVDTRSLVSSYLRDMDAASSIYSVPSTPDLMSDTSDVTTQSSGSSPPPSFSPPQHDDVFFSSARSSASTDFSDGFRVSTNITGETLVSNDSFSSTPSSTTAVSRTVELHHPGSHPDPNAKCAKCLLPLFSTKFGGRYVTVPEPSSSRTPPKTYHTQCFRCRICKGVFEEKERGQAVFVRGVRGACHLDCAPPEKATTTRTPTKSTYIPPAIARVDTGTPKQTAGASTTPSSPYTSSRYTIPLASVQTTSTAAPRFGSSTSCPGCHRAVSPMERGVVPGPQGTKWHATCLVCGGMEAKGRNGRRKDGKAGCGKKLDSSAKSDVNGHVWCRDCTSLLPMSLRSPPPSATTPAPLKPSHTGTSNVSSGPFSRIAPQHTGGTTIARQFTGLSGGMDELTRQMTGGGLSPTRQLTSSPTKGLGRQYTGGSSAATRPRPKSVIGIRDEGRGMFLVRQMTGGAL